MFSPPLPPLFFLSIPNVHLRLPGVSQMCQYPQKALAVLRAHCRRRRQGRGRCLYFLTDTLKVVPNLSRMAHSPLRGMFSQRQLQPKRRGCVRRGCVLPLAWPRKQGPPARRQGRCWGARSPRTSGEAPAGRVPRQQKLSWGKSQRSPLLSVVFPRMTERRRGKRAGLSKVKFVRNGT